MVKIRENGIERDLRNALALPLALTGPALTPLPGVGTHAAGRSGGLAVRFCSAVSHARGSHRFLPAL